MTQASPTPQNPPRTRRSVGAAQPTAWLMWLLVGLSVAWWGWRVWGHVPPQPLPLLPAELHPPDPLTIARALGAEASAPESSPAVATPSKPNVQLTLTGWAQDAQGQGVALMAVANQPPTSFRVGAMVTENWRLEALLPEEALLHDARAPDRKIRIALQITEN